ncbi:glycosyl hydrolase family 61-domain-containing protein [Irpex rosettiformis]|uniref:Glycosyl hydrolase family 61-domain-containing protein n=1 Tax=Irpex rosettiformis TaxID=378272 RepID=A0ACB8UF07_9APHY|nr:glycosyl hydrolase family 61-domain-containing protein [Irpex rosettiformis]
MIPSTVAFLCAFLLSAFVPHVVAHGFLKSVTIGGKDYPAWDADVDPYADPIPARVTRKVPDDGPVINLKDASVVCNVGGDKGAGLVAKATAGSQISFTMNRWPDDHLGPVTHYMTKCTNGDCKSFDPTGASWFKVDAAGLKNGVWATTNLIKNGLTDTMTIPSDLQSGQYLIRHELIALHSSDAAQVYPECIQVEVTGGGNKYPSGSALTTIPQVYTNFKTPDIWADGFNSFTIPGPAPAFGSSSSGANNAPPSSSVDPSPSVSPSSSSHAIPQSASSATPSKSNASSHASQTGTCRGHKARRALHHAAFGMKRHH